MVAQPARVLFLLTGLERGGAAQQVCELAFEVSQRSWVVEVVSMIPPGPVSERLDSLAISFDHLGMTSGRASLRGLRRYLRSVRRFRPDLVHSHLLHANLLARVGRACGLRYPLVNSAHGEIERSRWSGWAYRASARWCDVCPAVSRGALGDYRHEGWVTSEKLIHVPNGIRLDPERSGDVRERVRRELGLGDTFTFLNVARLHPDKDQETLLAAFASVVRNGPARLLIAGDGPLRDQLEALRRDLGLVHAVQFLGDRADVSDLLLAADGFVLSSATEGLPVALLEACAARLPVVATAVGDLAEVLSPDGSDALVPSRNPEALARALEQVQGLSAEQRERYGSALRARVTEQFDIARVADRWEAVYSTLI